MRGMHSASVDLIYLDPPFNSNQNYAAPIGSKAAGAAFKDTWTLDDVDRIWLLLLRDKDPTLFHVIEAARLVHGKGMASYLSMMAQRLIEMRRILKPSGSLYFIATRLPPTISRCSWIACLAGSASATRLSGAIGSGTYLRSSLPATMT